MNKKIGIILLVFLLVCGVGYAKSKDYHYKMTIADQDVAVKKMDMMDGTICYVFIGGREISPFFSTSCIRKTVECGDS